MSGKGSAPRPIPDRAAYEANWDRIFSPSLFQAASNKDPKANEGQQDTDPRNGQAIEHGEHAREDHQEA